MLKSIIKNWILANSFLFLSFQLFAQDNSILSEKISLISENETFATFFKKIENQVDIRFSYSDFPSTNQFTYRCENKALGYVLNDILSPNYTYVLRGKHIIVKSANLEEIENSDIFVIHGKVIDGKTMLPIANVSVFDTRYKNSCLTDNKGNFSLHFSENNRPKRINFSKFDFRDTLIETRNLTSTVSLFKQTITLPIREVSEFPQHRDSILVNDSIQDLKKVSSEMQALQGIMRKAEIKSLESWNRIQRRNLNYRNINDTLFSDLALSIFPPFSTNKLLGLNTVNKYAFHLFVGNSKGIERFEMSGLMNIDAGDVRYFQLAGIQNWVKGKMTGFQLGGIGNLNIGGVNGFQVGGIYNLNLAASSGIQVGGITSINTNGFSGVQISGIYNQGMNSVYGMQISGIANEADTIVGVQLSGIVNRANFVIGSQISLINVADTMVGVPIGLFSYVKKGYHKIELSYDDLGMSSLAFRSGVNAFHNIFLLGVIPAKNTTIYSVGYGLGSAIKLSKKWFFDIDATAQTVHDRTKSFDKNLGLLGKLFVGFEYRPWKKINVAFGPTFNLMFENTDYFIPISLTSSVSKNPYTFSSGSEVYKTWVGFKVGLRFL